MKSTNTNDHITLEIGCGSTDLRLEPGWPRATVGVDLSLSDLVRSKQTKDGKSSLVCGDALGLPFRSSSCDQLLLRSVLHHLEPVEAALREFARVLRVGGLLHISDGLTLAPMEAQDLDDELRAAGLPTEPVYGFNIDELTGLLSQVGFEVQHHQIAGTATFATPPFVSRVYRTPRFTIVARLLQAPSNPY